MDKKEIVADKIRTTNHTDRIAMLLALVEVQTRELSGAEMTRTEANAVREAAWTELRKLLRSEFL